MTRPRRRLARSLAGAALAAATAIVLSACGPAATSSSSAGDGEPVSGGELVTSRNQPFQGFELDAQSQNATIQISQSVMEPLIHQNDDGTGFKPGIASEWTFNDTNTELTIALDPDAMFSNGSPVTADDVAFSVDTWKAGPNLGFVYSVIGSTTIVDEHTIVFELTSPNSALPAILSWSTSGVIPRDFAGMTAEQFWQTPIGAGAFSVSDWSSTGDIVLEKNPHYYVEGQPYLDSVVNSYAADANSLSLQLRSGQLDTADNIAAATTAGLDSDLIHESIPHRSLVLLMNTTDPALTPEVRRAIGYAVDYEAIATSALRGYGTVPDAFLPPNVANAAPPTDGYFEHDDDAAVSELNGQQPTLTLTYSNDPTYSLIAQVLVDNLADVGITVELNAQDPGTALSSMFASDFQLTLYDLNAISPDASDVLTYFAISSGLYTGYDTTSASAALTEYLSTSDDAQKQSIVTSIEDGLWQDPPFINLTVIPALAAVQESVHGVNQTPWGNYYYATVWKD